jgi:tRNA A37 threonylcarbamoyladenosine dehydratase
MSVPASAQTQARLGGLDRLYGVGSLNQLSAKHVLVIGVGGVGSWAVEALARSGVGRLTLLDADEICLSNTNRQLPAMDGEYGKPKVAVMAARARAINPAIEVTPIERFLTPSSLDELLDGGYDAVLDACDAFRVKLELIAWCRRRKLPLVTVGSAGGRSDATLVRVRDLSRTEHDAMLSLIRKKLRQVHGFPRNPDRFFGVSAVYSMENVRYPQPDGSVGGVRPPGSDALGLNCGGGGLGAATHVTGTFAFAAVGKLLEKLLASGAGGER